LHPMPPATPMSYTVREHGSPYIHKVHGAFDNTRAYSLFTTTLKTVVDLVSQFGHINRGTIVELESVAVGKLCETDGDSYNCILVNSVTTEIS
jgi:hypothetical protein